MTGRVSIQCAAVAGLVLLMLTTPTAGQQSALVPFEIKDQFDRVHCHTDYEGRLLIMIGSDREGSEFHEEWESAIRDSLQAEWKPEEAAFVSVADVRGVPFFLKGNVKGKFSRDEAKWILLDWKGYVSVTYGLERNATNILVFTSDGALVEHLHGRELDPEVLSAILTAVRKPQSSISSDRACC